MRVSAFTFFIEFKMTDFANGSILVGNGPISVENVPISIVRGPTAV